MGPRILLIEDDGRLAEMVSEYLGEAGFRVAVAAEGRAGLERLTREPYDALVLDLMLPDMDGLEVCRQLRLKSDIPVLMLTARGEAMDRVVGLEIGADDYLPSRSNRESCWRACARSCGGVSPAARATRCASADSRSIVTPESRGSTAPNAASRVTSSRCSSR